MAITITMSLQRRFARRVWALMPALIVVAAAPRASAQTYSRLDLGGFIEAGGEADRYLRILQIAGLVPLTPWSIQPFAPTQARKLRATVDHPWRERFDGANGAANVSDGAHVLRPQARLIENSAFPFQEGGGPTWAGRGLTGDVQLGGSVSWRFVYAQLAPLAFASQNLSFALAPNGQTGTRRFADPRFPMNIDAPQRFGDAGFTRLEPGSSSLLLDGGGFALGATSAPQRWGPAREYPLVLSPNPGGFPTVFVGTSTPANLWLFRLHTRLVYSQLDQSSLSPVDTGDTRRFGSGIVSTIQPRGAPGLEIGGTRFIHDPWPEHGLDLSLLRRPLSSGLNLSGVTNNIPIENQVASVFARWALPSAKAEFYGEFYKEDYPGRFHSALSLVEKPDDLAAFTIGFQRVLTATRECFRVVRGELVNGQVSHQERETRGFTTPLPPYIHAFELQGHTVDGLIIGSPEAYGGAAWRLGFDQYSPNGRTTFALERSVRFDWLPADTVTGAFVRPDVIYAIRAEMLRFTGDAEWEVSLIPAIDLNRNLVAGRDVFNVSVAFSFRGWP